MYKDNIYKSNSQSFMLNMCRRYLHITTISVGIDHENVVKNTSFMARLTLRIVWRYYSPIDSTATFSNFL